MSWTDCHQFMVKEHVGVFKAANNFDLFDLESGTELLQCREEKLGTFTKILRFTDYKSMTPFEIQVRDTNGNLVIEIKRGVSFLLSKVQVFDGEGNLLGGFKQKLFSIGGKFDVLDKNDTPVCTLVGKWTGWDFRFMAQDQELAHVTKKWTGLGKELFTSADNYVLDISPSLGGDSTLKRLIIAAVMCIDMVLKE